MAKIKRTGIDAAALRAELDMLEERFGVPSESRHTVFYRRYRRFPFLKATLVFEETEDWRRWDRIYNMWAAASGAVVRDPGLGEDPRRVRPMARTGHRPHRGIRWGTAGV